MQGSEHKEKAYNPVIDILRIISILAVVLIHTTTKTLGASLYDVQKIPLTLFLNQSSRFAVPLFFIISGFVLELNYPFHLSYKSYLKKRVSRILIPYIFWSIIYSFFVYRQNNLDIVNTLATGSASYQLYFIPTLLVFYIIFPLIHKHYAIIANKLVLILLGALQFIFLYYNYYIHPLPLRLPFNIIVLNYYVFVLGIVASHHHDRLLTIIKECKIIIILFTVILAGYIFFEGENFYLGTHSSKAIYSQWRPSIFLYTILFASLLYYFFNKNISRHSIIKTLSNLSFFVFFIHVMILQIIWNTTRIYIFQKFNSHIVYQIWFDPLLFFIIISISFFIAFIAHKVPLLKKLCG